MENTVYGHPEGFDEGRTEALGHLIIIDVHGNVNEIQLDSYGKERLYIGRDASRNDLVIQTGIVSAQHGKFKISGNRLLYADLGSTNGTIYESNGYQRRIQANRQYVELKNGDMLRIQPQDAAPDNSILILYSKGFGEGVWTRYPLISTTTAIGRDVNNAIVLDHPSVSRNHALVTRQGSQFIITDLDSANGIFINGVKVEGKQVLSEKDVIQIAGETLIYSGGHLFVKNASDGINIEVRGVNKYVNGRKKKILDDVNCLIESNEFVAIVGGSGAGKTTMMNAISGFDRKISGKVSFNGIDVHAHFNELKNLIGYVPQEDIIYDNLTLKKMLEYTAKLKMPKDTGKKERQQRIQQVLSMVELQDHQNTYIRKLSGGQKKRASIAVEMLADPKVFFLDEPTSGLDPGTEQKLMVTLNKLSKSQGKTIVMVTHATQSLELCDKVLFMGRGGALCFAGDVNQAQQYFSTDNIVDIYNITSEEPAVWAEQYRNIVLPELSQAPAQRGMVRKKKKGLSFSQLPVLISRYMELIRNDRQRLALLFAQPVLIALLLSVVANDKVFFLRTDTQSILFALSCAGIWLGLFNSIQEVCKERPILKREYMGGLRLLWYAISKFFVQTLLGALQSALITGVFIYTVGAPKEGILLANPLPELFISVWFTIEAAMALGFVVSCLVKNGDRAMTLAPFVLIIQLLFSGILFKLEGTGEKIANITVSKWSMEALGGISSLNDLPDKLHQMMLTAPIEPGELYLSTAGHLLRAWGILLGMTLICLVTCTLLLRSLSRDGR